MIGYLVIVGDTIPEVLSRISACKDCVIVLNDTLPQGLMDGYVD